LRGKKGNHFITAEKIQARAGLYFAIPWILGLLIFYVYPLISSIFYSFTDYNVISDFRWVGLDNYATLLKDGTFWRGITNTVLYAAMAVPTGVVLGVMLALMLNLKIPGRGIFRTVFYLPSLVPVVATSIIWQWLLNPQFGLINYSLGLLGLKGIPWLSSPAWAKPSLVIMAMWVIGNTVIVYLAGLQDISKDYYEAADLDGANAWNRAMHITLPLLTPVIFFNLMMTIINTLQVFTLPYSLTQGTGKPADSLLFYSMYLYNNAFSYMKMGYASAMAWILFIVIFVITMLVFRSSKRWVFYQDGN
jgi:multiple sugar transport system permease protein